MHVPNGHPDARPALHEYNPPQFDDARSPCPALNALANHSYIPHSGRDIPFWTSVRALRDVYNLSLLLAVVLTLAGCLLSRTRTTRDWLSFKFSLSYSLDDLARHAPHSIEHDGSLSRPDAPPGARSAPWKPDAARLEELLTPSSSTAQAETLTLDDLCRVRRARDRALAKPLGAFHAEVARGEVALAHALFVEPERSEGNGREPGGGNGKEGSKKGQGDEEGTVSVERLRAWFAQDRLLRWRRPARTIGLFEAARRAREVRRRVEALAKNE